MSAKILSVDAFRSALFSPQWRAVTVIGSFLVPVDAPSALLAVVQSATDGRPVHCTRDFKRSLLILESDWDGRPESEAVQ